MKFRTVLVGVHRYVGLAITLFLVIAALTGSLLAFYHELDAALNPAPHPPSGLAQRGETLEPLELRRRLMAAVPDIEVNFVPLKIEPDEAVKFHVSANDDAPQPANDQYYLDPHTGEVLGARRWGDISQGLTNLMPFVFRLHYSLALGASGAFLLGIAALLWAVDCFVGAYLTFPPGAKSFAAWRKGWLQAWLVKSGGLYKLTFTWHRASGLWVWALLFVFAWSAVGLNLKPVYKPPMKFLFGLQEHPYFALPKLAQPQPQPGMSWEQGLERGRELMRQAALQRNFEVDHERLLRYDKRLGMFRYQVKSTLDISSRYPDTTVWYDSTTGELAVFQAQTTQATGNTISIWINTLHFAAIGGWPYQTFVAILGLLITILSLSGVYVWWVKRRARRCHK